jgi:hypothetical protein
MKISAARFRYRLRLLARALLPYHHVKKILCYPNRPGKSSALFRICHHSGHALTNRKIANPDLIIYWEDSTFRTEQENLADHYPDTRIINQHCNDISKRRVEQVFHEVFGYGYDINPLVCQGTCLEKNDINASHDCTIIQCPIERPRKGYTYQKLLDNRDDQGRYVDLRVPVFDDLIPHVYRHYRAADNRFLNGLVSWDWRHTDELFSADEKASIIRFCRELGMDYGELDILRDNGDDRIYIVDANITPVGPATRHMTAAEQKLILDRLSEAFAAQFLPPE